MSTSSGHPPTITPADKPQTPHIVPSDDNYIYSEPPLPITTDIQTVPLPPTKDLTTEPSDETLHNNSVEPLSIRTLNIVHKMLPIFHQYYLHQHQHHAKIIKNSNH